MACRDAIESPGLLESWGCNLERAAAGMHLASLGTSSKEVKKREWRGRSVFS